MTRILTAFSLLMIGALATAQPVVIKAIQFVDSQAIKQFKGKPLIQASSFQLLKVDLNLLRKQLLKQAKAAPGQSPDLWIEFPLSTKQLEPFLIEENSTMATELKKKFPQIKAYNGYAHTGARIKWDITPQGFHAMIMQPGKPILYIDPYSTSNNQYYILYKKNSLVYKKSMHCGVTDTQRSLLFPLITHFSTPFTNCALKKYRLALAATYSYTQFNGGTKASALAAQVVTVNRINGIYENDIGVSLELIASNADVICDTTPCPTTPMGTQAYDTTGNADALILQNQINTDLIITPANYDIGHVLDAFNGEPNGLAALSSVCDNNSKASATTISPTPQGDAFDVDFVAHEMGHQFGGTHTQNNDCNRAPNSSVEPGSGSTIMGYAGICPPNVQNNSGPYFHGISLQQIGTFTQNSATCSTDTLIGNAPTITGSNGNSIVPISTPFALNVTATSIPQANLTYDWEQMDAAISPQPPLATSTEGPNFRSFNPTTSPERYFPNLAGLASGQSLTWEVLPSVGRIMNFRVSVRNNTPNGSCNAYQDYTVTEASNAGPFIVTYPNENDIIWQTYNQETVTWDVAHTDQAPVNAILVDILLSTDAGLSYPIVIAQNILNNGAYTLTVPELSTNQARIMVRSSDQTFFNTSQNNFTIGTGSPTLTNAIRNPLKNTSAFIYFKQIPNAWFSGSFTLNGYPGATLTLDAKHNRFIIAPILSPRKVNVSVHINIGNLDIVTNSITIPGILGLKKQ